MYKRKKGEDFRLLPSRPQPLQISDISFTSYEYDKYLL